VKQLTVDVAVAEEMRNASLASASSDAQEFAKLRGRITELESQLAVYQEDKDSLAERIEADGIKLQESHDELANCKNTLRERDSEVVSLQSQLSAIQTSMEDALAKSAASIEDLQKKMELDASESHSRVTALQQDLGAVCSERDKVKENVSSLELRIQEYEHELQQKNFKISELDAQSSTLTERISLLDAELMAYKHQLEELRASSAASESALNQQLDDLRSKASTDTAEAERQRNELETQILVIREQCRLHTSELLETKGLLEEAEASKAELASASQRTSELEISLQEREARVEELANELAGVRDAVQGYEQRQATDADALEQLKHDHAKVIAEYEGRLSEMTNGANANASRHAALENEVSSLTGRLSTVESELSSIREEKDAMQKSHEQELNSLKVEQEAHSMNQESQIKSLTDQLAASEETCSQLRSRLTDAEWSVVEEKSHANEASSRSDASLDEALQKVANLEAELEGKTTSLEEMEQKLATLVGLEETVATLTKEKNDTSARATQEVERLHGQLDSLQKRLDESQQSQKEVSSIRLNPASDHLIRLVGGIT
jgi:chromosome segregation ATPase